MAEYIPKERQCPYCDSAKVQPLRARSYESESGVTWYECLACLRIWHREKPPKDLPTG